VLAALNREPVDRPPVISPTSVATTESMRLTGAAFPDAHYDAVKMAALASAGHDLLGFDCVMPYFGITAEAEALGAAINRGSSDVMPSVAARPFTEPDEFTIPADFLERRPVKTILGAIRLLKQKYGESVAVCGKVIGPWTLSYNLYGTENFLMDLIAEPEKAKEFLRVFKTVSLTFAEAQIEAGADMLTWADHATGDMVSAAAYEEFLLPVHRECAEILRGKTNRVPTILHTCGRALDRMPLFAQTGFDAFHFDSKNDPAEALTAVDGGILLAGCVNNVRVLLNGTAGDVKKQTREIMDAGVPIIAPECAVPCGVKNANLRAIAEAVREGCA